MKLTTPQIETIERYILSWDIRNQAFYYEILDHFISAVEDRMARTGEEFDYAFPELTEEFSYHKSKPSLFAEPFTGLKALEWEFQKKAPRKGFKFLLKLSLSELRKGFRLVWIIAGLILYLAFYFFGLKIALFMCLATNLALWLLSPMFLNGVKRSYRIFKMKLFRHESSYSLAELKDSKLISMDYYSYGHVFTLMFSVLNLVNVINFFELDVPKVTLQIGMLSFLFLCIPVSWAFYRFSHKKS